jgi:hypothetical protein
VEGLPEQAGTERAARASSVQRGLVFGMKCYRRTVAPPAGPGEYWTLVRAYVAPFVGIC